MNFSLEVVLIPKKLIQVQIFDICKSKYYIDYFNIKRALNKNVVKCKVVNFIVQYTILIYIELDTTNI